MNAITASPELVSLLKPLKDRTEIRDSGGRVLGVYTPMTPADEDFDLEEAERIAATEREGRPLKDILRDLEALGKPECGTP